MKQLTLKLLLFVSVVCARGEQLYSMENEPPQYIELDCDNDGVADRADIQEYVMGDFNGDGKQEYAALYYHQKTVRPIKEDLPWDYFDYEHYHYIVFGDSSILQIGTVYSCSHLVNEGDLNNDGCDDLGFYNWVGNTWWGNYSVLSYVNDKWSELVCIRHNESWNPAPYQELVCKDPNNEHHLVVKEIRVEDGKILDKVVAKDGMDVTFRFDRPIGGYDVVMHWQPYAPKGCETGTVIVDFDDMGLRFQYVNNEKFGSYFIDKMVYNEAFEGFKDGDEFMFVCDVDKASPYPDSPLDYYMPFQFYDVDFDGEKELLVNDWGQCQCGNGYTAYDITDGGIVEKQGAPFDSIDNVMVFDSSSKTITTSGNDGVWYSYELTYSKMDEASVQKIAIPKAFDKHLKNRLEEFASDVPSEFHITGAHVELGDEHYDLSVKKNQWQINK
jgi:hypothetical protein